MQRKGEGKNCVKRLATKEVKGTAAEKEVEIKREIKREESEKLAGNKN